MKNTILVAALLLLPSLTFADGHSNKLWNMAGLGNAPTSSKMMDGKTGSIMLNESNGLMGDWSEAPDGFPTLVTAEYFQSVALTAEAHHLVAWVFVV